MSLQSDVRSIELGRGLSANSVLSKGSGPAVVYLHGLLGQQWDRLLDGLSSKRSVYAPEVAGAHEPDELKAFDTIHDLTIYVDDVVRKLELGTFDLIGHSFGGMVAAEYAALFPERVRKLILIDPLGLWRDDKPVADFTYATPDKQRTLILGSSDEEAAKKLLELPGGTTHRNREIVRRATSMASILHFIWPIPERGLRKRMYRIAAPTQIIWGEDDLIVPQAYADDFASAIRKSEIKIIPSASHTPQFNKPDEVLKAALSFLDKD
ncbi:alpha/beta fold hydrolase [Bradyrhizobium sp. 23AC]